jgi:uncharacterized protein YigE (DUF2233 family)
MNLRILFGPIAALAISATAQAAENPCARRTFDGDPFTVCIFHSASEELRIASVAPSGEPLRSFEALKAQLGPDASRVAFAMNAGMFGEDGRAVGLLIENGARKHGVNTAGGSGNFHMKPNGVLSVESDGTMHVEATEEYIRHDREPQWATQSGPMLVIDGELHPQITPDGPSHYIRNGVGLKDPHTAYFVISGAPVSFGKLARFFRNALHCRSALYFDGSVSSLWAPSLDREDDRHELGPMVVVLTR